MLDSRKSAILRKVVAEHIETGQPVGSAHVVRAEGIDVSPATVRSDMATLEREGYLTHPHTSAGRIPTDKGYRFFVDHLEQSLPLDPQAEEQVREFFARAQGELERVLRDTSLLLSRLTDYAAVVVGPTHDALTIRSSLLARLGPQIGLLVVVFSNGVVDKQVIELNDDTTDEDIERASALLRSHLEGEVLGKLSLWHANEHANSEQPNAAKIVEACLGLLMTTNSPALDNSEIYVGGTARMAEQFDAVATVREVLSILEQSFVVVSLIRDVLSHGQTVSIGTENHLAPLAECSLVVAPYEVDNEIVGTIGVLGPTRMNYSQALATVAVVSQRLGRQLSRGE